MCTEKLTAKKTRKSAAHNDTMAAKVEKDMHHEIHVLLMLKNEFVSGQLTPGRSSTRFPRFPTRLSRPFHLAFPTPSPRFSCVHRCNLACETGQVSGVRTRQHLQSEFILHFRTSGRLFSAISPTFSYFLPPNWLCCCCFSSICAAATTALGQVIKSTCRP